MSKSIADTINEYNNLQNKDVKEICVLLQDIIDKNLNSSIYKIWHGSPVWFLEDNPIVAYSVRKDERVSLMFFSGQSFEEELLKPEGKFKAAEIFYTNTSKINETDLKRWLKKGETIQWDYKNIIKNKGLLKKL